MADGLDFPVNNGWSSALVVWTTVANHLDDVAAAAEIYPRLLPFAGQVSCNRGFAPAAIDSKLALAAATMGELDAAEAHFDAADALHEALGARFFIENDAEARARVHHARGEAGEAEARRWATRALEIAREHGYAAVEARAEHLLQTTTS